MIKVVDKSTGEYITFDYASWDELADQYEEVTQQIKALERAKVKMASIIKMEMGDAEKLELTKNRYFRKMTTQYKNYSVKSVMEAFGNFNYLKVDKKRVDEAIADEPEAPWAKDLRDSMYVERSMESLRLVKPESKP